MLAVFLILFFSSGPINATLGDGFPISDSQNIETLSATLKPGESGPPESLGVVITGSTLPLDILFTFDLTGSMLDEINECKTTASSMMTSIRLLYPDSNFGAASFMDYDGTFIYPGYTDEYGDIDQGDYPWSLDQDITSDTGAVNNAINGLTLGYGSDVPEDYSRVLYESQFAGWRQDSIKIVIVLGDAPTHDLDFYAPTNYGGDPGRDAIAQNDDDLDFETVVSQLSASEIKIITIDAGNDTEAADSFNYMADQTGGLYRQIADAGDIPTAVVSSILETATLTTLSLQASSGFEGWVDFIPSSYTDIGNGELKEFQIILKAPSTATEGIYNFDIYLLGSGSGTVTIATIPAQVIVTGELPKTGAQKNF